MGSIGRTAALSVAIAAATGCAAVIGLQATVDNPAPSADGGEEDTGDAATVSTIRAITGGFFHTCALTTSGGLRCWGINQAGELGDGSKVDRLKPVDVLQLQGGVTAVSASLVSCAVLTTGTVHCWGGNGHGEVGDGSMIDRTQPKEVASLEGATLVGTGGHHTCALSSSRDLRCWGLNDKGQLGDGTTTLHLPPTKTQSDVPVGTLALGYFHSCITSPPKDVLCWGDNINGAVGDGSFTQRIIPTKVNVPPSAAVFAGGGHSCAITAGERALYCWGLNHDGQLGDGTLDNRSTPAVVPGLESGVKAASLGGNHTCALMTSGAVKCWGQNTYGQLGDGTNENRPLPVDVTMLGRSATLLAAGGAHTCAAIDTGRLRCWGNNSKGQLGDDTRDDRSLPADVSGF